jgi:hypothetical protein
MITNFSIASSGIFRGNGIIPFLIKHDERSEINFQNVFAEFLKDVKRLHDVYVISMVDDQKITGRERIALCKELDNMIGDLILLRIVLSDTKSHFYFQIPKASVAIEFKIVKQRWEAFGTMGQIHSLKMEKFKDWISVSFSKKLNTLVRYTKSALEDDVLDDHETSVLVTYLDRLLLGSIVARNGIFTTSIS